MPEVQKIIIDNFLGGLAPSRYTGEQSQADPLSAGWYPLHNSAPDGGANEIGILQRGYQLDTITNISMLVGDPYWIKSLSRRIGSYAYLLGNDPNANVNTLYSISLSGSTHAIANTSPWPHPLPTGTGTGLEFYTDVNGNPYLYYATGRYLGRHDLSLTFNDSFNISLQTKVLGDSIDHPMAQGNGYLYVGNGNGIVKVNGDTVTLTALDLSKTQQIVKAIEFQSNWLYIAAAATNTNNGFRSDAYMYVWDGISTGWQAQYKFPEEDITAVKVSNGQVYVSGRRGLYQFSGSGFQKIYPTTAGAGFASAMDVSPDGIIYYKGSDSGGDPHVYSFGSPNPQIQPRTYIPFDVGGPNGLPVYWVNYTNFYVGYGNDGGDRLRRYSNTGAGGYGTATWRSTMQKFPGPARFISVRVHTLPLPSGCSYSIGWSADDGASITTIATVTATGTTATDKFSSDGLVADQWQICITHNSGKTPKITKIEIEYQLEQT